MKRLLALLLAASLLACAVPAASAAEAAYTDVPAGGWAEPYINRARELGLMAGLGGGRFGYGGTVTNAQFAQMICNIMGWETVMPAQPAFSDVRPGSWYYGAVETAYANGVYSEAETFRPDAAITRRAMAERNSAPSAMVWWALSVMVAAQNSWVWGAKGSGQMSSRGWMVGQ